jgi:hypothetical protein
LTSGFQRALLACSIAMVLAAALAMRATNTRGEPSGALEPALEGA